MAHELGHFLDMVWLGNRASLCKADPRFERWRASVLGSDEFARLDALAYDETPIPDHLLSVASRDRFRDYAMYLLRWKEMWARSYAQYVAARSPTSGLREQLIRELRSDKWALYHHQWAEESFEPIDKAMDELFEAWE